MRHSDERLTRRQPRHPKVKPLRTVRQTFFPALFLAFAAFPLAWATPARAAYEPRYGAIVVEADTGKVLSEENADRRSFPASLTKVMTLYLLFDALDKGRVTLDTEMPVSAHAARQAPSKLGMRPGDHLSVREAILALVTKSANDAAVTVAEALGGSEAYFAMTMTRRAKTLGMTQTTYRNASGLPNPGQISTPRDQAILARAMIHHHAKYYPYFATREFDWRGQTIASHNRLMLNYPGADGMKTGFINASGFNLIASAVHEGKRLVGVVFGGETASRRDRKMASLLDDGFARVGVAGSTVAFNDAPEPRPGSASFRAPDPEEGMGDTDSASGWTAAGSTVPASWTIQVGAFGDYRLAQVAAHKAARSLGGLPVGAAIDIDPAQTGGRTVHRARLTGFTEDQARSACHRLSKSGQSCHVVQPSA